MTINNSPDIKFDLEPAPHIHSRMTTSKMMGIVLGALIPAYCVMIYFFGYGVLIQFLICAISCCVAESIAALLRKRKPVFYITDLSALVTAGYFRFDPTSLLTLVFKRIGFILCYFTCQTYIRRTRYEYF